MQEGLTNRAILKWVKRIESETRLRCPDYSERVSLEVDSLSGSQIDIKVNVPAECLPDLKDVISWSMTVIPTTT